MYISDRNSLYCLGTDSLQTRWKYDFQDKEASTAHLLLRDGKILMLNYGYGKSLMRGTVKCGKPFLASFDAQTGDRERMFPLYDKKHVMSDGMLTESGVFLAGSSIGKLKGKPVGVLLKGRNVLAVYDHHLTVFRL